MISGEKVTGTAAIRLAKREGHIAIWGNVVLAAFKFAVGFFTGSLAIIADAWHTLSDSLSSVVLLIGLKISGMPADREHPFGHGRAELITAIVIGMILAAVGFEFVCDGIKKIHAHESAEFGLLGYAAMISTVLVKEAMAQYAFWAARKTGMTSLRADGFHHRSDSLSSIVILAGMVATNLFGEKLWWMDGALGAFVGAMLIYVAWTILRTAGNKLLGESVPDETIAAIENIVNRESENSVENLHHFHIHVYGEHREITFHMRMDPETTLRDAHACGTRIEKAIAEELGIAATIHIEPKK